MSLCVVIGWTDLSVGDRWCRCMLWLGGLASVLGVGCMSLYVVEGRGGSYNPL